MTTIRLTIRLTVPLLLLSGPGLGQEANDKDSAIADPGSVDSSPMAYGRFVPEREDDFAWENDKVTFRVYGPASRGQGPVSGVDAWFKRVEYPIVDKWYAEHLGGKSYHVDHGEGYDVYHVGTSRGVGGTAVWVEGVPYPAGKFTEYKILESGGNAVEFTLQYEWETPLGTVAESKTVSLALGERLYSVDSVFTLDGEPASLPIAIGLTTHDGAADASGHTVSRQPGRISTWEVIDGHGVGTGAVLGQEWPQQLVQISSDIADTSHTWMLTASDENGLLDYRAGFAWQADGEITSADQWNAYLDSIDPAGE